MNDPAHLWPGVSHGLELIHRTAIVRLGVGGPELYYPTNHGALGVTAVAALDTDDYLTVYTDFGPDETCLHASADVDLTLARKGVFVGASGGASVTKFGLYSSLKPGTITGAGYSPIRPDDPFFNLAADNLWIHFVSARPAPVESEPTP